MSVDTPDHPREPDPSGRDPHSPRSRLRTDALLDRWPFRRKLNVLVIVPIVVVGVLLGVGVYGQVEQARDADRVAQLVRDSEQVAQLINDVQAEHRQALLLAVRQEAARPGAALPSTTDYGRAQRVTDHQADAMRSAFGSDLPKEESRALGYVQRLSVLRDKVERGSVPAAGIDPAYAAAVGYLIDGIGLDRYTGTSSASVIALLDAVLRADAAHAAFEGGVFSAQTRDANAVTEYTRAVGAHRIFEEQSERFARLADPSQVLRMDGIERSSQEHGIEDRFAELQIDPGSLQGQSPSQLRTAMAEETHQAEARLDITRALTGDIAARADRLSDAALYKALGLLGLAVLGFAVWLGFSFLVRRSVVRPLAALTGAAHQVVKVADEELAKVEDDDESADSAPLRPRPIPVPVRDEIGDLAEAFNQVQVTAAALLERQVISRRNVGEMFGNVGRRVSNLTTRQLMLIDAVEREETAPDILERMYRIDHIAVRLQRNADSLMLLAGIRESELDARPTTLADVIRGALGQIEGYQRVSLRSETEVTVVPDIMGDLTLMLAELLENAVAFSPADTPIEVVVRPGTDVTADGGALVEVIDHGLGMSAERLAEENARLVRRERLDLVPTKVLGLFVVGGLARRSGIRVTLSRTPGGGVTGTVWVPSALLLRMGPGEETAPEPTPGRAAEPLPESTPERSEQREPLPPVAATPPTTTESGLPKRVPARTKEPEPTPAPPAASASRPLRRRVRGATLDKTAAPAARAVPAVRPDTDADEVRSELDEFEAAVRRAERDAEQDGPPADQPAPTPPSTHQLSRKESGSEHADR
ncbi:sensor histidine kinase [Streptomyces coffeae]|uniref:sensor histidine kinase n=1 Tax=Streptomyces coffeae TaxID=621382 RepID=UPI0027DE4F8D|nr:HAMP domain-containing sensor histidine kinase [Streptomyces coffeae]